MDKKNNNDWFQDIIPPANQGFNGGMGYLDRLMVGSNDPLQRQLLSVGSKAKFVPARNNKNKGFAPNKQLNNKKKSFSAGPKELNIDDLSWIAERKKKFPKIVETPTVDTSGDSLLENPPCPEKLNLETKPINRPFKDTQTTANNRTKNKGPVIAKRKMTLFEKLMDDDQQTN